MKNLILAGVYPFLFLALCLELPAYGQTQSGIHYDGPDAQELYDDHVDTAWESCKTYLDEIMPDIPGVVSWNYSFAGLDEYEVRELADLFSDERPFPTFLELVFVDFAMPVTTRGGDATTSYACAWNIDEGRMWAFEIGPSRFIMNGYWIDDDWEIIQKTTR